jgi:hypothetical protein
MGYEVPYWLGQFTFMAFHGSFMNMFNSIPANLELASAFTVTATPFIYKHPLPTSD